MFAECIMSIHIHAWSKKDQVKKKKMEKKRMKNLAGGHASMRSYVTRCGLRAAQKITLRGKEEKPR